MKTRRTQRKGRDSGFTLVELITILALVAVLSIATVPAISAIQRTRERAATTEVARWLTLAQRRAVTTGEATGVRIDPAADRLELLCMPEGTKQPVAMKGPTGDARLELHVPADFPGVTIESFLSGAGSAGAGECWFDATGTPQERDIATLTPCTQDARIQVSGGGVIIVRAVTGAVEW